MENLLRFLDAKNNSSKDDLWDCFEEVGSCGDIIFFKKDGIRTQNLYNVLILSGDQTFDPIGRDAESLEAAARLVFPDYLKAKGVI